jgi:multidrug transporter EmrE-like cation transporter
MPLAIFIASSTILGVAGQLALKHGMSAIAPAAGLKLLRQIATAPWVVGGLVMYGTGVLFWLAALSRLDVSYLYPFASLSYIGIIVGSHFLFNENVNRTRLIGIACVILGVILSGLS